MHSDAGVRHQTNGHLDNDLIRHLGWLLQDDPEPAAAAARAHIDSATMQRRLDVPPVQLFSHTPAMPGIRAKPDLFEPQPAHQLTTSVVSQITPSASCVLPLVTRRDSSGSDVRPMSMQRQMSLPSSAEAAGGANSRSGASQERLERIREKNRRASTRFREKQKREREEMAARANDLQSRIQTTREHRAALQHRRSTLATRSATATSCLGVLRETFHDLCRAALPDPAPAAPPGSLFQDPLEPPLPLDAFKTHVPLSLNLILDSLPDGSTVHADAFARGVRQAKAGAAAQLELPASELCWHVQSEYEVAEGSPLAFSAALRSLECIASLQLQHHTVMLEMAFLRAAQQHANSEAHSFSSSPNLDDQDKSTTQPLPWTLDPIDSAAAVPPCIPPAAVDPLRVRCGVRDTAPLSAAVDTIIRNLLQAYLPRMPLAAWRGVCQKMLRLLHSHYGQPLRAELPQMLQPVSAGGAVPDADAANEGTQHLLCAIGQLVSATLCSELQSAEAGGRVDSWQGGARAAAAAPRERLSRLQLLVALSAQETLSCAPVVSRQLAMRMAMDTSRSSHTMDGIVTRAFQSMALPAQHKAALARTWHQWLCRRATLDQALHSVLCALQAMPLASTLCTALDGQGVTPEALSPMASAAAAARAAYSEAPRADPGPPPKLRRRSRSPPADTVPALAALPPLLGQDATATAAAAAAMAAAAEAHEGDMCALNQLAVQLTLPSPLLSAQHHQFLWDLQLERGLLCFDHLHLCRIASDEERHSALLQPMPPCILPRPE